MTLKAGKQSGTFQIQHRDRKIGVEDNIQNQVTVAIITVPLLILHALFLKPIRPIPKTGSGPFLSGFLSRSENRQYWLPTEL